MDGMLKQNSPDSCGRFDARLAEGGGCGQTRLFTRRPSCRVFCPSQRVEGAVPPSPPNQGFPAASLPLRLGTEGEEAPSSSESCPWGKVPGRVLWFFPFRGRQNVTTMDFRFRFCLQRSLAMEQVTTPLSSPFLP